ncbi:MAG: VOC family protein [Planctomycetes bacterium]|nr:VOC family protein [Planctomycetota bacterium]
MTAITTQPVSTGSHTSQPCVHGEFCWHECSSRDLKGAEHFYATLFEATAAPCPASPTAYTILSKEGHATFGLMGMGPEYPKEIPAHWMGYIAVDDLDATFANVATLGGKVIVPPKDITIGRFCMFRDPTGAHVSLFQAHPGKTDGVNWSGDGLVGWNELMTTDPKSAVAFYTKLLGWTVTESTTLGFPYWMFASHGRTVAGLMARNPKDKSPSHWLQYVQVADIDSSVLRAKQLGGAAAGATMDIPGIGRVAAFTDPNGASFAMWQPAKSGCCSSSGCGCGS